MRASMSMSNLKIRSSALAIGAVLAAGSPSFAADLTVNGTTDTVSTPQAYDNVFIGQTVDGGLAVISGGSLTVTQFSYIGEQAGITGTATITDNATWSSARMRVGDYGIGTLDITNGADVSIGNSGLVIATQAGSTGQVDISGAGSTITAGSSGIIVGQSGTGTLNASNGASLTASGSATFGVGTTVSGVGTATLTGSGTSLTAYTVLVGGRGNGTMSILDGADVTSTAATVGGNPGAIANSGTATVSGAGSTWTNGNGDFQVGFGVSSGTLNIQDSGLVATAGKMVLGWNTVSQPGTVTVTGAGSTLDVGGELSIGRAGTGVMTVSNGATVDSGTVYIGQNAGGVGTLNISGASTVWDGGPTFYAGYDGTGTLNISGGADFTGSNYLGYLFIGYNSATAEGTVNISGAGTEVVVDNYIQMDGAGIATLNVTNGAKLTADYLYGGSTSNQTELLVSGAGSLLTLYYGAYIGYNGDMHAVVTNNAALNIQSTDLNVGRYEIGTLEVSNGAQVTAGQNVIVGSSSSSVGTLILSTGGSVATPGTVTIAGGSGSAGTLIFGAASGDPAVAAGTLDAPTVQFGSGSGEIVFNHTGNLAFAPELTGTGAISVLAGTTTFSTSSSTYAGDVDVAGGKAVFNANFSGADVTVSGSGVVGGSGTVASLVAQSGGTVAPGNSPGTLNVAGNVSFAAGSTYAVEIDGTQHDLITATGAASLTGGHVVASGSPALSQYAILTAAGGVTGAFDGVQTTSAFINYRLDYDPNTVYLIIDGYNSIAVEARTRNQYAVANALDQVAGLSALYFAVAGSSIADLPQALDAVSGEIHASVGTALADDNRYVREAITGRLIQAYYGGAGAGGSNGQPIVLASAAPTHVATIDTSSRMSLGAGSSGEAAPSAGNGLA